MSRRPPVCAVYDGGCPMCRSAAAAGRRLAGREVTWIAAGDRAALEAAGVPDDPRSARSILVHDGAGGVLTEGAAVAALVGRIPVAGPPLGRLIRALGPAGDRAYRWVAARRRRAIPGRPRG